MLHLFTIGVYGSTEAKFFDKLAANGIDTFCDIRLRRAVRGSQYAFANSNRLQERLTEMGIHYLHIKELTPPKELLTLQAHADEEHHIARRQRQELSPQFVKEYKKQRLAGFNPQDFIALLPKEAKNVALFCVEKTPVACHRSLVAEKIGTELGVKVTHL